jgi:hypothetical protein
MAIVGKRDFLLPTPTPKAQEFLRLGAVQPGATAPLKPMIDHSAVY